MAFTESDVYNNEAFFEQYMKRRYRENSPNEQDLKTSLLFNSLVMLKESEFLI